jgi:flagellar basal body-associated protein FliL
MFDDSPMANDNEIKRSALWITILSAIPLVAVALGLIFAWLMR